MVLVSAPEAMRFLDAGTLVGLLVVATFASGAAAPTDGPTPADTTVLPFGVEDCTGLIAIVKAPALRIAPYLPVGFTAKGANGVGPVVNLAIEADHCARMTTRDGVVEDGAYGSVWVAADPPAALRDRPGQYFVGWDALLPDADRQALLAAAGFAVHQGAVRPVADTDTGAFAFEMQMDGLGTFHSVATGVNPPLLAQGGTVVQFNEAPDGGLARWTYRWTAAGFGHPHAGVVTLPPDSWIAEVVGGPVVAAQFFFGEDMTYRDGTIEFPIANPAAA